MSRNRRSALLACAASVAAVAALALPKAWAGEISPDNDANAAKGSAAMAEVWRDNFDGSAGSQPSSDNWIVDKGTSYPGGAPNWGTGEVQTYTDSPDNLQLDGDGHLKITALKDGSGTWTSSRIETQRTDFAAPAGGTLRIEASARVPDVTGDAGQGYWPAFWTLGEDFRGNYQNWPGIGEFDILENVNGANTTYGTLHCGVNPGGPCNETMGLGGSRDCPDTACQAGFHTYALELDRTGSVEELRWYVDGQQFHSVKSDQVDTATWENATHHGHFLLLNLAMGGGFPDGVAGHATPTDATRPGGSFIVDYVSVQQSTGALS